MERSPRSVSPLGLPVPFGSTGVGVGEGDRMLGWGCRHLIRAVPACVACLMAGTVGLVLTLCLQGSLVDGRIIDTSLSRDPLVIELGQKQVIAGM